MIVSAAKAAEAASVLGLELGSLTPDIINKAFRSKAKECHPDQHGTAKLKDWSSISWAKECLLNYIQSHTQSGPEELVLKQGDCRACGGSGRVKVGFNGLTMWCVLCRGEGTITPLEVDND